MGAAKIILDKDLNSSILSKTIYEMLGDKENLIKMGELARKVSIDDVEDRIYAEIQKLMELGENK